MPVSVDSKDPKELNIFQQKLIGTWCNQVLPGATKKREGGPSCPLSYNVMPLPQDPSFILKNFTYYEQLKFESKHGVAIPAIAPNRGNASLQLPIALFYDQHVFFAEGPGIGTTIHVENGAWLNLLTAEKVTGPYFKGKKFVLDNPNKQPTGIRIAKQMSVPHGNSILALGSFSGQIKGAPSIPDAPSVLPTPINPDDLDTDAYRKKLDDMSDYQNPHPLYTTNTNLPLQQAVTLIEPNMYIHWCVSSKNQGQTMNIPFEQRAANVTGYEASYWLLSTDSGESYPYLAYTQNISMQFTIKGSFYNFPHVTSNVVTKVVTKE